MVELGKAELTCSLLTPLLLISSLLNEGVKTGSCPVSKPLTRLAHSFPFMVIERAVLPAPQEWGECWLGFCHPLRAHSTALGAVPGASGTLSPPLLSRAVGRQPAS